MDAPARDEGRLQADFRPAPLWDQDEKEPSDRLKLLKDALSKVRDAATRSEKNDSSADQKQRSKLVRRGPFSSLTRRIISYNIVGLIILVAGVLVLNQYQAGLIDARINSLATQGQLIAGALAEFAILDPEISNPEPQIAIDAAIPIIRRMALVTNTRVRLYDSHGDLVLDSRNLISVNRVRSYQLPPPGAVLGDWPVVGRIYDWIVGFLPRSNLPRYDESRQDSGWNYEEVAYALAGDPYHMIRVTDKSEMVISVSVPVQRLKVLQGALLLSTEGGDIDEIVRTERLSILQTFLIALCVTVLLSILLAQTIARPIRRLAEVSEKVRFGRDGRVPIPNLKGRQDEIGDLSIVLGDMTDALYTRIDSIEQFAADVAHEIKNPLTSLRSAVETLEATTDPKRQKRLLGIIIEDVARIDRLITDISDASRLDAELTRTEMGDVCIPVLLETLTKIYDATQKPGIPTIRLTIDSGALPPEALTVPGFEHRLGQVVRNIIDNAISFSEPQDEIRLHAKLADKNIVITIDDQGPGIPEENLETIFERFYTQRPSAEDFGKNSGLGLAISKQIIEAHRGRIFASNRRDSKGVVQGARFTIELPL